MKEPFVTPIVSTVSQYDRQTTIRKCVLASTGKMLFPSQRDEKAGGGKKNVSEMSCPCILEEQHVKLLPRKMVVKEND